MHQPVKTSETSKLVRIVIVGGGFAGLNAAKILGNAQGIEVTLIDKHNHHLFQPLLHQVAMAGPEPRRHRCSDRSILSPNFRVLLARVEPMDLRRKTVRADIGEFPSDYLILSCGALHSYF